MPRTQNKGQGKTGRSYLAPKNEPRSQGRKRSKGKPKQRNRAEEQARVTEPLTPKGMRRETRTATNLRFKPLEKAIAGDLRASERRVGEQGDWWQNYLDTVSAGQADTSAAYAQAAQAGQAQIGQASAIDTANTERLQGEAAKSAELRGVAPSTAPAEREAAAQAQRNYLAAAQGGATAQMGANQRAYLNEQKRIGVGQSIASRKEEQRRGRSIRQDRRDVRRERGDYAATKRGELRAEERDYLIQRQAFGLDKRKAAQEARDDAVDNRIAQQNANSSTRSSKASAKNAATTAKNAAKGGLTPSEKRTVRNEKREAQEARQNAMSKANQLITAHGYPKTAKEWADLEEAVAKESEVSPAEARRAVAKLKEKAKRRELDPDVAGHSGGR